MKSRKLKIQVLFIYAILICMTDFFGFYKYLPFGNVLYGTDYMHICVFICTLIFFVFQLINNHGKFYSNEYSKQGLGLVVLIAIEIIWTYFRYHQPIQLTLKEGFYYFVPLFTYTTFVQYKNREADVSKICNSIIKVSIVSSLVALIAFVLYTYEEINILQLVDSSKDNFRNGTIRFGIGTSVVYMATIVSITKWLRKEYSKIDVINLILALIQIVVINKTRTMMLYMVMLILLVIILGKNMNIALKSIMISMVILCGIGAFVFSDSVSINFIAYFNSDDGIMMRFNTIEFYMKQFKEVPVLGMGLISTNRGVAGWQLIYGSAGYYYRDDVGIVGLLNKFGIAGLLWVIWYLRTVIYKVRDLASVHADIVRNIVIFCTITLINLSFMDCQRVMYIFVMMIISDAVVKNEARKIEY